MQRLFLFVFLLLSAGLSRPAAAQAGAEGLPPRPTPFRFVNDAANLLAPADANKLEGGLRQYADKTGTQVVVVTVPTLGGREVADYGRALGTAWGVGQRDKNNGVVVLIGAQERKVTIQPGSGLAGVLPPEVTKRIIGQQMGPQFKQGNYFAGLRSGLNTLMLTANPSSDPRKNSAASAGMAADASGAAGSNLNEGGAAPAVAPEPVAQTPVPAPEPESSGFGMMPLLLGALVIGGGLWFLLRMFRNRGANNAATGAYGSNSGPNNSPGNAAPNFLPNRPNGPGGYGPGQPQGNYGAPNQGQGGGLMGNVGGMGGGMGMGGMLATGAAAAAGAYLGNRMASGHDTGSNGLNADGNQTHSDAGGAAGAGLGAAGTGAGNDYFTARDGGNEAAQPDYFSSDNPAAADNTSDYFSSGDNSSSDDSSSDNSGGGGFDGDSGSSDSY